MIFFQTGEIKQNFLKRFLREAYFALIPFSNFSQIGESKQNRLKRFLRKGFCQNKMIPISILQSVCHPFHQQLIGAKQSWKIKPCNTSRPAQISTLENYAKQNSKLDNNAS